MSASPSTPSTAFPESSLTPSVPREVCLETLARVLASEAFGKSARLAAFLRYVCTVTVEGQAAQLCEQHIGVAVFGRPDHYNPADDTIVRSTARLLRLRLAHYYEGEGRSDDLRIAIPRGSYVPVFVPTTNARADDAATSIPVSAAKPTVAEQPSPPEGPATEMQPSSSPRRSLPSRRPVIVAVLMLAVALLGATLWPRIQAPSAATFWTTLLPADRDALLVAPDAGLVLYQLETGTAVSLEDYAARRVGERQAAALPEALARFRARQYTGMSAVQFAAELGKRATAAPQRLHWRFARDVLLSDLKHANAILLGVPQSNPWASLYRSQLDFHIDWDPEQPTQFLIRNDHPRAGEPPTYEFRADDPRRRGFATIAYTRGLGGDGHALLLGGTMSAGTDAAIELLVDPARMAPLLKQAQQPDGSVASFEILLQCVLQANGSTDIQVLGFHVHAP